jgi:hypothetical protein
MKSSPITPIGFETDFAVCPWCIKGRIDGLLCEACTGQGLRPLSYLQVALAISAQSWLTYHVRELFNDYCEVYGIQPNYHDKNLWFEIKNGYVHIIRHVYFETAEPLTELEFNTSYLYAGHINRMRRFNEEKVERKSKLEIANTQRQIAELKSKLATLESKLVSIIES